MCKKRTLRKPEITGTKQVLYVWRHARNQKRVPYPAPPTWKPHVLKVSVGMLELISFDKQSDPSPSVK